MEILSKGWIPKIINTAVLHFSQRDAFGKHDMPLYNHLGNFGIVSACNYLYIYMYKNNLEFMMHKIHFDEDIQPLSTFRSKVAFYFDQVKKTKRPLVITQNGKSSAILLDVGEYQQMVDKIEVLEDIKLAEQQISEGATLSHSDVRKKFSKRF